MGNPPTQKPILLLAGGPTTHSLWRPLAEHYQLVFLYSQAAELARSMDIPDASALESLRDPGLTERIANTGAILSARVVAQLDRVQATFTGAYHGALPELDGHLVEWLPGFAHQTTTACANAILLLERLREREQSLAGCVVHEDVSLDTRLLVLWCGQHGIPTIHVPHQPCHLLDGVQDVHRETRTDWLLASGQYEAEWYAANGFARERIRITGAAQLDELYSAHLPRRAEARRVLMIENERVIEFMPSWFQTTSLRSGFADEFNAGWQAVLGLAEAWKAVLLVKIHPNDGPGIESVYHNALTAAGLPGLVTREHANYLTRAADLVVAQGPTNGCIGAAILGTPSCYLQTEGFDFKTALPFRGTVETIQQAAEAALASAGRQEWDEMVHYYNDTHPSGGASESTVKEIVEICSEK